MDRVSYNLVVFTLLLFNLFPSCHCSIFKLLASTNLQYHTLESFCYRGRLGMIEGYICKTSSVSNLEPNTRCMLFQALCYTTFYKIRGV